MKNYDKLEEILDVETIDADFAAAEDISNSETRAARTKRTPRIVKELTQFLHFDLEPSPPRRRLKTKSKKRKPGKVAENQRLSVKTELCKRRKLGGCRTSRRDYQNNVFTRKGNESSSSSRLQTSCRKRKLPHADRPKASKRHYSSSPSSISPETETAEAEVAVNSGESTSVERHSVLPKRGRPRFQQQRGRPQRCAPRMEAVDKTGTEGIMRSV